MKYIGQICLIFLFSFLGELCSALIPLPIPAAVYGMVLLVACLLLKLIKFEWIREAGSFLTGLLPLLFVAPVVGLLDSWQAMAARLGPILLTVVVSTIVTFGAAGMVTRLLMKRKGEEHDPAASE